MLRQQVKALLGAGAHDLRKFGLTVGGVLVLAGLLFLWRHKAWSSWLLAAGAPLVILAILFPRALKWIYAGWMTAALVLGAIVSTVLLTLLFYLVVTPIGLLARLFGRDFLKRKPSHRASSCWIPRDISKPKQKHEHERQF